MTTIAEAALVEAGKLGSKITPLQKREAELAADAKKPSKEGLQFKIDAAQVDLDKLPPADPGDLPEQIKALAERIAKGEDMLAQAQRLEGAQEVYAEQISKREKLTAEAEVLDALVKVLSPKGRPGKILSETIGPIETRANEKLQEMTGGRYQLHIQVDPDFLILVDHDGIQTDLEGLSTSEKWRVGLVLQDAIAQLSGLKFLLIDSADILDPANRVLFTEALLEMAPDYDQIIVFATIDTGGVHPPEEPIEDLGLYLLQDGQLEEVV
jgi:exonuclease SbcC